MSPEVFIAIATTAAFLIGAVAGILWGFILGEGSGKSRGFLEGWAANQQASDRILHYRRDIQITYRDPKTGRFTARPQNKMEPGDVVEIPTDRQARKTLQ